MYLDQPDILAASLPDLVTAGTEVWQPVAPAGFVGELVPAMGGERLLTGPGGRGAGASSSGFWSDLILLADCPRSQYDALRETLAKFGPPPANIACLALTGRGFHGQHGRRWATAPGNLHLSAVVVCDLPAAEFAAVMPALPAVAVVEAIGAVGQGRLAPEIKWINDILLGTSKVAGVLTGLRTHRGRITAVVLGVGLNVAVAPEGLAEPDAVPPTSLHAALPAPPPDLGRVLTAVLAALAERCTRLQDRGPQDLLAAYRHHSAVLGKRVIVRPDASDPGAVVRSGEVVAIEADLSLRLHGHPAPIASGRLALVPEGT